MNSNNEDFCRERARIIIRNYSIASATASGTLAIGATIGIDTAFSVGIVVKMINEIGELFGLRIGAVASTPQFKA